MARRNRRCRPRGAGKRGENDITLWDHVRLQHDLIHDPRAVLAHFSACNIAFLSELGCWAALVETCAAKDVQRIVTIAALFGIGEAPRTEPKTEPETAHGRAA